RVRPGGDLDRAVALADVAADDLDAMAAEIDDGASARLLRIPEPRGVRAGVRLARTRPRHVADLTAAHSRDGLERLRRVDEILEVPREDSGALCRVEDAFRLLGVAGERLRAEHGLAVLRAQLDRLEVEVVRQADDADVRRPVRDRLLEVGRGVRDAVLVGERA